MKRSVQLGFVFGLVAVLAAAYFLPWLSYQRFPSATTAVINGGRSETFLIRLPNDRIQTAAVTPATGNDATPVRDPLPATAGLGGSAAAAVEHYRLRDLEGNVIGVAARHATESPDGAQASWLLTLPSRGSVAFGGPESGGIDAVESALSAAGWVAGQALETSVAIPRLAGLASVVGTREFDGIEFELNETWSVTGVDADGHLHGTVELETVGRRGG